MALIIALLSMLVLSTLTASFVLVSQTEVWNSSNYKTNSQARYLADAGQERTLNWMRTTYNTPVGVYDAEQYPVQWDNKPVLLSGMDGYTSNFPDDQKLSFQTAMNQSVSASGINGTYSARAEMLYSTTSPNLEIWKVTSEGRITGVRGAVVETVQVIERRGVPVFNYGLFATGTGCAAIGLSGAGIVDSYDSSAGTYLATKQTTGGDIGSNGNVTLTGSSGIYGTSSSTMPSTTGACATNALTTSSSVGLQEEMILLLAAKVFDSVDPVTPTPPTTDFTISSACGTTSGCHIIDAGLKIWSLDPSPAGPYGNIKMSGGTLRFSAGIYNINGITQMSGGSQIEITSGPVRINVQGKASNGSYLNVPLSMSGGSIMNDTGLPSSLAIVYGGTGDITLSGGSAQYGVVYAPNADVSISSGTGAWYGAVVGKTFTFTGGSSLHYDAALKDTFVLKFTWVPTSFSRSKY